MTNRNDDADDDALVKLLSALARGDAKVSDVAGDIKEHGHDSLDVILTLIAKSDRKQSGRACPTSSIDPRTFLVPSRPEISAKTVHKPPRRDFVLNGTVYDPSDIGRFNGTDLHLVATPSDKPILAFDDKSIIGRLWQDRHLANIGVTYNIHPSSPEPNLPLGPITPQSPDGPVIIVTPPPPTQGSNPGTYDGTFLYEDVSSGGDSLFLPTGWSFSDLSSVGRGIFGLGDWDDIISSLHFVGPAAVCLCESAQFQGSTYSFFLGQYFLDDLSEYGWNDRASSIVSWS